jgi:transposase
MLTHHQGDKLPAWAARAEASDVPELRTFAASPAQGLGRRHRRLTQPWSSGTVEGQLNRIKVIKRQMYGRARPDLLRKHVLFAN